MEKGKVKFFNHEKGFGFIVNDANQEDVFVHKSGTIDHLKENDSVEFDVEEGRKGLNAVNVRVID